MSIFGIIRIVVLAFCVVLGGGAMVLGSIISSSGIEFNNVWQLARLLGTMKFIEERYVDEVDPRTLVDGAIKGMVEALGDPHSNYLDEGTYQRMKEHTEGSFGGIGIVMGFANGGVQVMSVMEGTPAEQAGLQKNDEVLAVDGVPVQGMAPELIAKSIRGKVGSTVQLLVKRDGEPDQEYEITRDIIRVETCTAHNLENGLGYIRIASFSEKTGEEFAKGYNKLLDDGMQGLIIDLRANPGGLINSCVQIGNIIVPEGPIVSVVERDGTKETHNSTHTGQDMPIVVLIDHDSASASEIIAGALQDTGAATIVGMTSYGKGSVQVVMPIPGEGDAIKLTIAKYYTPSGRSIQGTGVKPDVEVALDMNGGYDNQLVKAVEVLKEKMRQAAEKPKVLEGNARNRDAAQL